MRYKILETNKTNNISIKIVQIKLVFRNRKKPKVSLNLAKRPLLLVVNTYTKYDDKPNKNMAIG